MVEGGGVVHYELKEVVAGEGVTRTQQKRFEPVDARE
jgi:hypothetical protein